MPRVYKPKLGGRRHCQYTNEKLEEALGEIRRGCSLRKVSERYKIPRTTLKRKLLRLKPGTYGGQTVLSKNEEKAITEALMICAEWGFPLTKVDLKLLIKGYLDRCGRTEKRFKNNIPGDEFIRGFLQRHQDIRERFGQNIKRVRAEINTESINEYFDRLQSSLENVRPESLINYDETNFTDDPGKTKILCKRGAKRPVVVRDSSKTSTSVMMAGAANGNLLPPYVIYKAENLYPTWIEGGPPGTVFNRSKSGWFDERSFEDWFEKLALPYLKKQPAPRALIGDNLSSHVSFSVINECSNHDIRFILLPPNATHLCQPLDVAFFSPLKRKWREILTDWKKKNRGVLPKAVFPRLLKNTIDSLQNAPINLRSGFAACGIYPLDRERVLKKLPDSKTESNLFKDCLTQSLVEVLKESRIGNTSNQEVKKKPRKKKLDILPGQSVTTRRASASSESSNDENISLHDSSSNTSEFLLDQEEQECEKSLELREGSSESILEPDSNDLFFQTGEFVLVQFPTERGKRNLRYAGKIVERLDDNTFEICFLRKSVGKKDIYFSYPNIEDKTIVDTKLILFKLKPCYLRRDRYKFINKNVNFDMVS